MGLLHAKLTHKSKAIMIDKENFTSNMSLQSTLVLKAVQNSLLPMKSALKSANGEKLSSFLIDKMMTTLDITKLYTEIPVETMLTEPLPLVTTISERTKNQNASSGDRKLPQNFPEKQIHRLGLHEIQSHEDNHRFKGVIYLPDCSIVLGHYMTLYRLKLDNLSQRDFQDWCYSLGHINTSHQYFQLRDVYKGLKETHFRESFIINRILSKQNVILQISDSFTVCERPLRALVFIGRRRQTVQNIIESYCFDVLGKVAFVIKSTDDYGRLLKLADGIKIVQKSPENPDISNNISSLSRAKLSFTSSRLPLISTEIVPNVYEEPKVNSVMYSKSDKTGFFHRNQSQSDLVYEPFSNYLRCQRFNAEKNESCYNCPILFGDTNYNLVSIIADQKYAYILCKNTLFNFNSCNEMEYKSLMFDEQPPISPSNQSNSFSRFRTLQRIMKTEIFETFAQRCYGVSLNQVPCGQFYVVQCTIEGRISEREELINQILIRHMVCGKIINKEYSLEVDGCGDINFILHLHGNERHIRKCCCDLKSEGLAQYFKLVHPRAAKFQREKSTGQSDFII